MKKKICTQCNISLEISMFYKMKGCKFGVHSQCKKCLIIKAKKHRKDNIERYKNTDKMRYQRTKTEIKNKNHIPEIYAQRKYNDIKNRCRGLGNINDKYYLGLEYITKNEFIGWSINDSNFKYLFKMWELSGFKKYGGPSIDRIDPEIGYIIGNMQWITFSENCSKSRPRNSVTNRRIYEK